MSTNVLVTGCSSGIGLRAAVALGKAGFRVLATMRDVTRRERLDEAARAASVTLDVLPLDVRDESAIERAVRTADLQGGLDVLVNNAGAGLSGFVHDVELSEYRELFETNFFGVVAMTKAFLPGMIRRRRGRIINVSSFNGRVAFPCVSAYVASKFAVEGFTESLRIEAAPFEVWATLIEPGGFRTDIFDRNRREARRMRDPSSPYAPVVGEMDALLRKNERHLGDPDRVARVIVRAAGERRPELRYVVGADARAGNLIRGALPWGVWERFVGALTRVSKLG